MQIKQGKLNELLKLKKEIVDYLANKKFSTKSITLIKTIKIIDDEIYKRKSGVISKPENLNFEIKSSKHSQLQSLIPSIFNDKLSNNQKKTEKENFNFLLKKKNILNFLHAADSQTPDNMTILNRLLGGKTIESYITTLSHKSEENLDARREESNMIFNSNSNSSFSIQSIKEKEKVKEIEKDEFTISFKKSFNSLNDLQLKENEVDDEETQVESFFQLKQRNPQNKNFLKFQFVQNEKEIECSDDNGSTTYTEDATLDFSELKVTNLNLKADSAFSQFFFIN